MNNNYNNQNTTPTPQYAPYYYEPPKPEKPPHVFTVKESLFAWLAPVCGYLFCRAVPVSRHPFGGLLFALILFGLTTVFLCLTGKKPQPYPSLIMASVLPVALSLFISSNSLIHTVAYFYTGVAYIYYVYSATGNRIGKGNNGLYLFDFIKALFILPFLSPISMFMAMINKNTKLSKVILRIIIGIGLAVIPTAIIWGLLSFDSGFNELMRRIFFLDPLTVISHIVSIAFGVPVGMYIFSLFISSSDKKGDKALTADACRNFSGKLKIAPSATVWIAAAPVLILYVIFFVAQWSNYFSAFGGVLPDNEIYSEYARSGFFELCWVAVVNLILIALAQAFTKRKGEQTGLAVRLLTVVISLFTLVLISTAMSKMVLYIERFGLTPKRVYAAWFIVLLAIVFIFIIIKQFVRRFNFAATAAVTCIVMFCLLGLGGTDRAIASYNIDRCAAGTLEKVDLVAMNELGDSAIVPLAEYLDTLDPTSTEYVGIEVYLRDYKSRIGDDFFGLTLPREAAKRALANR